MSAPRVSVLLPVLDEERDLPACLTSLVGQDLPEPFEVLLIDGGSRDGTREVAASFADRLDLRVVDNPERVQSLGCNLAAGTVARGDVLVRLDGHALYAADYLRRSVEALAATDAVAVGGRQRPEGTTPFGRAAAAAMASPLAAGPGRYRYAETPTYADTVYLGTFRREDFLAIGGYRHFPSGVAEDTDLYYRWRRSGHRVLLDPAIRSTYRPRATLAAFWRQHHRYGAGKAEFLYAERTFPSWRPLAPLGLVIGLPVSAVLSPVVSPWPAAALLGLWVAAVTAAGVHAARRSGAPTARTVSAVAAMQLAYGIGLLAGLARGPGRVRGALEQQAARPARRWSS